MTALDDALPVAVASLCRMPVEQFNEAHWPAAVIAGWLYAEDLELGSAAVGPMTAQALRLMNEIGDRFTAPVKSAPADASRP